MSKVQDLNYTKRKLRLSSLLNNKNNQTPEEVVWRGSEIFITAFFRKTVKKLCVGSAVAVDGCVLTLKTDQMTVMIQLYSINPFNF